MFQTVFMNTFCIDLEGVRCDEGVLERIMEVSGGDMRRAVTFLQSCSQLCRNKPISVNVVIDISGSVRL